MKVGGGVRGEKGFRCFNKSSTNNDLGFLSFLLLQMFLTEKDKVVVVTRIVYFFE